MSNVRPFEHPECLSDELFIGDFNSEEFEFLPVEKEAKRQGKNVCFGGLAVKQGNQRPVFIKRKVFGKGCTIWTRSHKHEH